MASETTRTIQSRERRIAWDVLRNSATGRMAAAMSRGLWPFQLVGRMSRRKPVRGEAAESDRRYFRRRSDEERRAAGNAAGIESRSAHAKLAQLYAGLARGAETLTAATQH